MFSPFVRILLTIVLMLLSAFHFYYENYLVGIIGIIVLTYLAYVYFKYGTVYIAWQELKKGNLIKAKSLIEKIKYPELLAKGQKNYYHFICGIIALEYFEFDKSYHHLKTALDLGLRTENDQSITLLNLAIVTFHRKNIKESLAFIAVAEKLHLNPEVQSQLLQIKAEINNNSTENLLKKM